MSNYFEEVIEKIDDKIIMSDVRLATLQEISRDKFFNKEGKCKHNIVRDERGWMYDYRFCDTCGKFLGLI